MNLDFIYIDIDQRLILTFLKECHTTFFCITQTNNINNIIKIQYNKSLRFLNCNFECKILQL
jgi:hypothetical protein